MTELPSDPICPSIHRGPPRLCRPGLRPDVVSVARRTSSVAPLLTAIPEPPSRRSSSR